MKENKLTGVITLTLTDKLPQSQQDKAKSALHEIYQSATRLEAETAFTRFVKQYQLKYPKAAHPNVSSEMRQFL